MRHHQEICHKNHAPRMGSGEENPPPLRLYRLFKHNSYLHHPAPLCLSPTKVGKAQRRHLISSRKDVFNSIKRIDKDIAISREIFERCAYTTGDVFSFHKQPHTLHRAFDSGFYLNRINIMPRLNHIIHLGIASRLLTMPAIQRIRAIARGSLYQFCCDKNFSNSTTIHHK